MGVLVVGLGVFERILSLVFVPVVAVAALGAFFGATIVAGRVTTRLHRAGRWREIELIIGGVLLLLLLVFRFILPAAL
jgi:hypothetical protein